MRHCRIWFLDFLWLLAIPIAAGLLPLAAGSQDAAEDIRIPQRVISFEHINRELVLKCDVGFLAIKAYADNIIHVSYSLTRTKTPARLWGIRAKPSGQNYRVESAAAAVRLVAGRLAVRVDRKTAQLTFLDAKQNVLLASTSYRLQDPQAPAGSGACIHAEFRSSEQEAYYGPGEDPGSSESRRGQTISFPQHPELGGQKTAEIPFLLSSLRYGIVFNNPSKTTVSPGKDNLTTWDAESGTVLSYFVIYGETWKEIHRGFEFLTARY